MTADPDAHEAPAATAAPSAGDWRAALTRGGFGAAYQAFLRSDAPTPEVGDALSELSEIEALLRDKAWARALKRFQLIESRPDVVDWQAVEDDLQRLGRSGAALDRRQPDAALAELDAAPWSYFVAEAETQRGTALIYDDALDEAAACFRRALDVDPRHFRAITNLGNVALEEGRVDDAIADYQRALALNDEFANAHHNLAVAYRRKGQMGKSVSALKRAQRLTQRRDANDARAQLGSLSRGRGARLLRWSVYAVAVVVLYLVLHARGML